MSTNEKQDEPKAVRILKRIQEQVGGDLLMNEKGAPRLVICNYYSVCYFARHKSITIFDNYGNFDIKQNKTYFKQWLDAATWLGVKLTFHEEDGEIDVA